MSEDEAFLARWSRRKRAEAAEKAETVGEAPTKKRRASGEPVAPETEPFDVTTLPPIESITELTDITAFLQKGVPAELTRAALRRVWTADPAIRDFVGLAENAWDFTDPTAMPGFGPLESSDEIRQMVAQVVEQIGKAAQPVGPEGATRQLQVAENSNDSSAIKPQSGSPDEAPKQAPAGQTTAQETGNEVMLQSNIDDNAVQRDPTEAQGKPKQLARRGHGSALPQ